MHQMPSGYTAAGQKSAFECLVAVGELRAMVTQLRALNDSAQGRVHQVDLCLKLQRHGWGRARLHTQGQALTVL